MLDKALLLQEFHGLLWNVNEATQTTEQFEHVKTLPVEEEKPPFSFTGQVSEHEEQESKDISEPVAKLKNFLDGYYSDIHPITGKKQSVEEYLCELITEARDDLRRGNYFDKEAQIEFLGELESYLTIWQGMKARPSSKQQ